MIVVKSISFGSKIHRTLYLNVSLIAATSGMEYKQGSPLKESVGGLTLLDEMR